VAAELGCSSVAFPAISCGVYGYPVDRAGPVAVGAVRESLHAFDLVRFVFLDEGICSTFAAA